jgi:hypothetical protein
MKITDTNTPTVKSGTRIPVTDSEPQTPTNVTAADDSPVMMNLPEPATRGSRADALIAMAQDDTYRLGQEAARNKKMKG